MLQGVEAFMSANDLESGGRWSHQLADELEQADFGIICLTPDNLDSAWLLFEAGALSKHIDGRACGLLFDELSSTEVTGPLAQFQHRSFFEEDFRRLTSDVNRRLDAPLEEGQLDTVFGQWWARIAEGCREALEACEEPAERPARKQSELLEEMLLRIRGLERNQIPGPYRTRVPRSTKRDHFYTVDSNEAAEVVVSGGYIQEASQGQVHTLHVLDSVPLYRLFSPSAYDHFYTTSEDERDRAQSVHGYGAEGIACYVFSSQRDGTVPLYRLWHPIEADHFYTTSEDEREIAVRDGGYRDEGVACFVLRQAEEGVVPLQRLVRVG
jgi:hypothetical protein